MIAKYIILFLIYTLNIIMDARSDAKKKYFIDHEKETSALLLLVTVITLFVELIANMGNITWALLGFMVGDMIFFAAYRFALFSPLLNHYKGLPIDYVSNKVENNSKIDTALFRYKDYQWHLRALFLVIAIVINYFIIKNIA